MRFLLLAAVLPNLLLGSAGELRLTTGPISINGTENEPEEAKIFRIEAGRTIETMASRAEYDLDDERNALRLGPGVKLTASSFDENAVALGVEGGAAIVELRKKDKGQSVTVDCGGVTVTMEKAGVYRLDCAGEPRLRVYKGKAVAGGSTLGSGQEVMLAGGAAAKFSTKGRDKDEFQLWHDERSELLEIERISSRKKTFGDVAPPGSGNW